MLKYVVKTIKIFSDEQCAAHQSLKPANREQLEKHATILSSSLDTIEACGGGSDGDRFRITI
jgi:hypothetical protein